MVNRLDTAIKEIKIIEDNPLLVAIDTTILQICLDITSKYFGKETTGPPNPHII